MSARVRVHRPLCAGSGNCVMAAPEVFDQDDADGLVLVRDEQPADELLDSVEVAVQLCPVGAIALKREKKQKERNGGGSGKERAHTGPSPT
ncbi:ferredoxin [Streptomyces sp. AV19]|uniref:ferredoxin n=1 Tax=Streptomyces sp. AV19 TaxID=2793068 RepID=UPI0018FEB365|nr:ferredoxin [Streptomyces sp. AV19]MBH1936934.1 ferredoxin [Streptomyces sp. AV19]MDG4532977.1 ferredoxin [Streptomyces sp. AV19]